jgi:hypothetical protein
MKKIVLFLSLIAIVSGCKKTETVSISNNYPPPDYTLENIVYESYINKSYILALGSEPDSIELQAALNILKPAGLGGNSRERFLNLVFANPKYRNHVFTELNVELLNNLDTNEISNTIGIYNYVLGDSTFMFSWPVALYEKDRLLQLQTAPTFYVNGTLSYARLQNRMLNNYFYDQINMGTLNFVNTSFKQILDRNPTIQEQQAGVSMCDGFNASLFLTSGYSKDEYLNIIFNQNDYYEATVKKVYRKYLLRDPKSLEMVQGTQLYKSSQNFESIQKAVMVTNEFIGI